MLIRVGDLWGYRGAPGAPPADWKDPAFDDSAWPQGPTGIGYGYGDDATVVAKSPLTARPSGWYQSPDQFAHNCPRARVGRLVDPGPFCT
jgi:hypothetical protein